MRWVYIVLVVGVLTEPCAKDCLTCNPKKPGVCLTCDGAVQKKLLNEDGQCVCFPGYYQDVEDPKANLCLKCYYQCNKCLAYTVCSDCDDKANRIDLSQMEQQCPCKEGYFDFGQQSECKPCDSTKCKTCIISDSRCIECSIPTLDYDVTSEICECNQAQGYLNGTSCVRCAPQCNGCQGDPMRCNYCADVNRTAPSCSCPVRFYNVAPDKSCESCHQNCLDCLGPSLYQCISCEDNKVKVDLSANEKTCLCDSGYYMEAYQCRCTKSIQSVECYRSCQICTSPSLQSCQQCDQQYILVPTQTSVICVLFCQKGYTEMVNDQKVCLQCLPGCYSCWNERNCSKCVSTHIDVISVGICQEKAKKSQYFDLDNKTKSCKLIHYCLSCSQFGCQQCNDGFYLAETQTKCILDQAQGIFTFYVVGSNTCGFIICDECCSQGLMAYQEQCFSSCPNGTIMMKNMSICLSNERYKQYVNEYVMAFDWGVFTQSSSRYELGSASSTILQLVQLFGILSILCIPTHGIFSLQTFLIYQAILDITIPPESETLLKQIFFYSYFNEKLVPISLVTAESVKCLRTQNCLANLNIFSRDLYQSIAFAQTVGPQFTLLMLLLGVKVLLGHYINLLHQTKYRKHHRVILVQLSTHQQLQKFGLRILLCEKLRRAIGSYMTIVLTPPILVGAYLNLECSMFQNNKTTLSLALSLLAVSITFYLGLSEYYTYKNMIIKHGQSVDNDNKYRYSASLPGVQKEHKYLLNKSEWELNKVQLKPFLDYLAKRQYLSYSNILHSFCYGLTIFVFRQSSIYILWGALLVYITKVVLTTRTLMTQKLLPLSPTIIVDISKLAIKITKSLILLQLLIVQDTSSTYADQALYWMIIFVLIFGFIEFTAHIIGDFKHYHDYFVIAASDDTPIVKNPYRVHLHKKVLMKLNEEVEQEKPDYMDPRFRGEVVHANGTIEYIGIHPPIQVRVSEKGELEESVVIGQLNASMQVENPMEEPIIDKKAEAKTHGKLAAKLAQHVQYKRQKEIELCFLDEGYDSWASADED